MDENSESTATRPVLRHPWAFIAFEVNHRQFPTLEFNLSVCFVSAQISQEEVVFWRFSAAQGQILHLFKKMNVLGGG